MRTIAIAAQKGGTGKTTTTAALAAGMAAQGLRVVVVDADPQSSLSTICGAPEAPETLLDVMRGTATAADVIHKAGPLAIVPGSYQLTGADAHITGEGRERRLRDALASIADTFDVCLIDTPPALGLLTVSALTAADEVLITCLPDVFALRGLEQIAKTIAGIRATTNPKLQISGVLLTRYNSRQRLAKKIVDVLSRAADQIGTRLLDTRIRESASIREAQALGRPIFADPRSAGAEDYTQLVKEMMV